VNLFSTEPFLRAVAAAGFPGRRFTIESRNLAGQSYRLLVVEKAGLVASWPFLDFLEPVGPASPLAAPVAFLPSVALATVRCAEWSDRGDDDGSEQLPAPRVDWTVFSTWEGFLGSVVKRRSNLVADSRRRAARLASQVGPLRFEPASEGSEATEAFDACLRWKSAQYRATSLRDLFADPRHVALFRCLQSEGALIVSALYAGARLTAVHLGARWDRRFYYWIPAYDAELARFSPGRLLTEAMLEDSYRRGDREFDFLIGGEAYKWFYATDVRVIGPLGRRPLVDAAARALARRARKALEPYPAALRSARELKRWSGALWEKRWLTLPGPGTRSVGI